ncbi:unnamed protein product, partial [Effrenium voratum]
ALSLYGTDLFLVQTFFRNKSAGQIKTKYQKEMRKNPKRVEEALTERAQKLTKDTFEKLHGKIDVSKHYKPPPSPQPGDEPEAHEPEIDEDMAELGGMPPPEPEYSAEDESLTTNRLMALFARQGERDPKEHQLDYWTCLAGAGLPLLQWHAGDFPDFAWFGGEDEKLFQLPAVLLGPLRALHVLVPGVWLSFYLWRWLRGGRLNLGKLWIMVATYFTWYMGMCGHHVRSLAFINLFHGISSSRLV